MKALCQDGKGNHWVCDLIHRCEIKEEIIAINHYWDYNQAYNICVKEPIYNIYQVFHRSLSPTQLKRVNAKHGCSL